MERSAGVNAARLGLCVNVVLGAVKVAGGVAAGSVGLLADGLHSLTDVAGSIAVLIGLRVACRPADRCHPYGHLKAESLSAIVVSLLIMIAGANVLVIGIRSLLAGATDVPHSAALVVIVLSIIVKELLFRYQLGVAQKEGSTALYSLAWEQRSDAYSSLVVLGGVVGSRAGVPAADAAAGVIVAAVILKIGVRLLISAVNELMDRAADPEQIERISEVARSVPGVRTVSDIRTRTAGPGLFIELTVTVDGSTSVADGHVIADRVEEAVGLNLSPLVDAVVHVEPDR